MNIKEIEYIFNNYSKKFDLDNYNIKCKYHHSYRVESLSKELSKKISDQQETIDLATTIGLLHDIGRYRQIELFNSFNDANIDHADLGVDLLFHKGLIKEFPIPKKYYDLIYFAIKNHNKYSIESCSSKEYLEQAKIIRDTDKIDILYMHVNNKMPVSQKEHINIVSSDAKLEFYQNKPVRKEHSHTIADTELLRLAFFFDINFDESLDLDVTKKILEKYSLKLQDNPELIPYLEYTKKYIKKRSKKLC